MPSRHLLLIAGMHRSGTSALCAVLERCGASFGSNLLNPMAGVNEDGFWEDADVVHLNQRLLERLGGSWFAPPPGLEGVNWTSKSVSDLLDEAEGLLARGFGRGPLEALKDPRLCLTLPLWLAACERQELPVTVCIMSRAPLEIARSLEKRDGFPPGYGLRLYAAYRRLLAASAPPGSPRVTYEALLRDAPAVIRGLPGELPLVLPEEGLADTVKPELRHHEEQPEDPVLGEPDAVKIDQAALEAAIERAFPVEQLASDLVLRLVARGEQLIRLGEEHAAALHTLDQRDADVAHLSSLHREALATIDERDTQIQEFDRRLAETGAHLALALDTLRERDEQLQRVLSVPVIGHMLRAVKWVYERR